MTTIGPHPPSLDENRTLYRAIQAAGITFWSWNVDSDALTLDEHGYDLWGVKRSTAITFGELSSRIHPVDHDRVRAAFAATRAMAGAFEIDFRIMVSQEIRWISARGQGEDVGIVNRTMVGVFMDVTRRKQAEEGRELLAGEMSHRVKNLLAIATTLTKITSQSTKTVEAMTRELTLRLTALGRAHDLARPLPGQTQAPSSLLGDLLSVLLAPYDDLGAFSGRIRVSVPRMQVNDSATTIIALIVHELATNSLKYGSLSCDTGTLDVSCSLQDNTIVLVWAESGGPPVAAPAGVKGYGSKLLQNSISRHLGGSVSHDWAEDGLVVTMRIDPDRVAA